MRTIKRYSNRKLYDTTDKKYITLEQIAALVRDGEDIKVIDNQSQEDLTTVTLSQVLLDQEKKKSSDNKGQAIPKSSLLNLIQRSSSSVMGYVRKNVFSWFENSFASDKDIEENVDRMERAGEITKAEAIKLKDEFKSRTAAFKARFDEAVERRVDEILGRLHIPSKTEISKLNQRLDELSARLEQLNAERSEASTANKADDKS